MALNPLRQQLVVVGVMVVAAVSSELLRWLPVSSRSSMWGGVALAGVGLMLAALMVRWPALLRLELLVPAVDFVAVGFLRYGTGDSRSLFLAAVLLPLIWVASQPGRWFIVVPLVGTAVTFAVPMLISPEAAMQTELARLVFVLVVFAAVATAVNELARQATLRVINARRRRLLAEGEVSQAALVQQSLLPTSVADLPDVFTVRAVCLPARTVGGDFYDWFPLRGGASFTLGDVMGKGVGAGMIAAVIRSVIRATAATGTPAELFERVSLGLARSPSMSIMDQFTTCFHMQIEHDGTASWVDAGHGLSLLIRAEGSHQWLRSGDLPVGVGSDWTGQQLALSEGDMVISVSDGILDLFGGDLDSVDRLEAFVVGNADPDLIVDRLTERAQGVQQEDDVTVMVIRFDGSRTAG